MCNRVRPTRLEKIARLFNVKTLDETYKVGGIGPWGRGPFVRIDRYGDREGVVGQWALIGDDATTPKMKDRSGRPLMTNNARSETVATRWTFRGPWERGQRCLVPVDDFDEPNWETGKNVWWRFARPDGEPIALAGIWNDYTDPVTGEITPSYTVLTQNCDADPVLARMHKPDPKLPADKQDKRTVVPVDADEWDVWLRGSIAEARALIKLPPVGYYTAGPAPT